MAPDTTPAVRLIGAGKLEHVEMPVPAPGPGEVLIRVLAVGLCGSDAHWFEEGHIGDATVGDGLVLGHELSGVIETGPRSGERVAIDPAIPCGKCELCLGGRSNLCLDLRFAGHGDDDGGLRRYLVWPERCLVPLPDNVSDDAGALLEPLGVALHAIDLAPPGRDASVGVIGCGPIGLLLIGALESRGVGRIVATDRLAHRVEAARAMGADVAIDVADEVAGDDQLLATIGGGLDVVYETAGNDAAVNSALLAARPGGTVALIGIPPGDRTSLQASQARRKELAMIVVRRMLPSDLHRAAGLAGDGLEMEALITDRHSLGEAEAAFRTLMSRTGIKVIIQP